MDFLDKNYFKELATQSKTYLQATFDLSSSKFSDLQMINAKLLDNICSIDSSNLLISLPKSENIEQLFYQLILIPVLNCFLKNLEEETKLLVDNIIIDTNSGDISQIKTINGDVIEVLKVGTLKRVPLNRDAPILILSKKVKDKITEIQSRDSIQKRQKGIENIKSKIVEEIDHYRKIYSLLTNKTQTLPANNKNKIVVVASKTDFLRTIPDFVPFQYINKSGEVESYTSLDPLMYVVNNFNTAKEYLIEKNINIDTILFIGENKYRNTAPITKLYRQKKINRCIFIGTENIESHDHFKVFKWNWTLHELRYFLKKKNSTPNIFQIQNTELSKEIISYTKIIQGFEDISENLVNLKQLLKFIRKIYPITAVNNEQRIRSWANNILQEFEKEAEELFQDEYSSIDKNYKNDFATLKNSYERIISLIKKYNFKAGWFKDASEPIDFVVVPNILKNDWEKEVVMCSQDHAVGTRVKNFTDLTNILKTKENKNNFNGLKLSKIITLKEFENKEPDNKTHLFISLYGYKVYPDTLIEKIYARNLTTSILLYNEEYKAYQYYLQRFDEYSRKELKSKDREELCGLEYPDSALPTSSTLDEWIRHLIELDNHSITKADDFRYEITFEDEIKTVKERESKAVYVEDDEDHCRVICHLKKGDKVRIYQNPDKEILHDIIKMTDEKELFIRVDKFSALWKSTLRKYYRDKILGYHIDNLYEELKNFGLTVEKNSLENWLKTDSKTKFPKRKRDMLAIIKAVNHPDLTDNIQTIFALTKEYSGKLNQAGIRFSEEINNYIITKEKGNMLSWLSDNDIDKIISEGAPLKTVKSIKKLDYEISN